MEPLVIVAFLLGLLAQGATDLIIAHRVTIPKVTRLVTAEAAKLMDEKLKPLIERSATLRSGVDPRDAVEARMAKKAERDAQRAETEANIFAFLVERFGEQASAFWHWVPEEVREGAINAGDRWGSILGPIVKKAQARAAAQSPSPTGTGAWN